MSKAIYGHLGASDALLVSEVARLRRRVAELEEQVAACESELVSLREPAEIVALRSTDLDVALRELGEAHVALT
jgi:DNA invertase Pin-like site-specific DNA recombinase